MNDETFGEMIADIKWIKQALQCTDDKYAPKWIMYPVLGGTAAILTWVVNQWLIMIPKAEAIVAFITN